MGNHVVELGLELDDELGELRVVLGEAIVSCEGVVRGGRLIRSIVKAEAGRQGQTAAGTIVWPNRYMKVVDEKRGRRTRRAGGLGEETGLRMKSKD